MHEYCCRRNAVPLLRVCFGRGPLADKQYIERGLPCGRHITRLHDVHFLPKKKKNHVGLFILDTYICLHPSTYTCVCK